MVTKPIILDETGKTIKTAISSGNTVLEEISTTLYGIKEALENQNSGGGGSYDEGYADGAAGEYNAFWDAYQENGNRKIYDYAFRLWQAACFNPKYAITGTNFQNCFASCYATEIKVDVDLSNAAPTGLGAVFQECYYLKTISKLILPANLPETSAISSWIFAYCNALETINFEGQIKNTGWSFQWSTKMSKATITAAINALSPTTTGMTITFSKTAKEAAFTADEWATLIATKSNWTISLA